MGSIDSEFDALWVRDVGEAAQLRPTRLEELPNEDLIIRVKYSSLNYKDALAVCGRPGIVRKAPVILGIDFAGEVESSKAPHFKKGDRIFASGFGLGESRNGGYSQFQKLSSKIVLPLPDNLTCKQAMALGTAGLTAMLAIDVLRRHGVLPQENSVLVTGAGGGVGGIAVHVLSRLGYKVTASTGRLEHRDKLVALGAYEVVARADLDRKIERPLLSERFAGAVDSVGGDTLSTLLAMIARHGVVAACGLAGGTELHTTVMPFILRGVALVGIDANYFPLDRRASLWQELADLIDWSLIDRRTEEIALCDVPREAQHLLQGQVYGRRVIAL